MSPATMLRMQGARWQGAYQACRAVARARRRRSSTAPGHTAPGSGANSSRCSSLECKSHDQMHFLTHLLLPLQMHFLPHLFLKYQYTICEATMCVARGSCLVVHHPFDRLLAWLV